MKKFTKIFAMMLVVVMVVGMFSTVAFAEGDPATAAESGFQAVMSAGAVESDVTTGLNTLGGTVVKVIQTVGYIVAVIMVLTFAIKWMVATPQKKQELKDRMVNLAIGLVLLVGGVTILGWITSFAGSAL